MVTAQPENNMAVTLNKFLFEHRVKKPVVVEKTWGRELWFANNSEHNYCGKILEINSGQSFSMHAHKLKAESFFCLSGRVRLEIIDCLSHNANIHTFELNPGGSFDIEPLLPHKITALEDSKIIEASTFHREDDSYRYWR